MAHRKWKETKLQPGTAGPGNVLCCCLVSFHFLWAILCPQAVVYRENLFIRVYCGVLFIEKGSLQEEIEQNQNVQRGPGCGFISYCEIPDIDIQGSNSIAFQRFGKILRKKRTKIFKFSETFSERFCLN